MTTVRARLNLVLALVVLGSAAGLVWTNRPSADVVTEQAAAPVELVVSPSVWTVTSRSSGANAIAVKGTNGFSGPVTVTVSGLPTTVHDRYPTSSELAAGEGGYYCSSHCQVASNSDFPVPLTVSDGQWTSLGPTLLAGSGTAAQTKTVTVTATANGQSISKSFTLKVVNDEYTIPQGGGPPTQAGTANPDAIVTVNNDAFNEHKYKVNLTAGQTKSMNVDVKNQSGSAVTVTLTANLSASGLDGVTTGVTGGLSSASLSLAPSETKTSSFTVATTATTTNGAYEFVLGVSQADGSNRAGLGVSTIVTGSSAAGGSSSGSSSSSPSSGSSSGSTGSTSGSSGSSSSSSSSTSSGTVSSGSSPTTNQSAVSAGSEQASSADLNLSKQTQSASSLARLEIPLRQLVFHAQNGQPASDQTLELKNTGPAGSVVRYSAASGSDWLTVTPTEGEIPGGTSVRLGVKVKHDGLASGHRAGEIRVTERDRATNPMVVTADYQLDLFKFSLPSIYTKQVFTSTFRPGFSYDWSIEVGNEGTASGTAGLLVPIPDEYRLLSAQILGPSGELLTQEPGVVVAAIPLQPNESRTLRLSLQIPPGTVRFPGQEAQPGRVLRPGQTLPVPKPFIFSTLSPERWQVLKASVSPTEFPAVALKESLEATEAQIQAFRAIPDQAQYQSLLELSSTRPYFANNLASYVMMESYTELAVRQPLTGLLRQPSRALTSLVPKAGVVQAQEQSFWQRLRNEIEYYKNFGINVTKSTAQGFVDGRNRDALAGLASGGVEVASFGLLPNSVPPAYGHQSEFAIGRTTGIIAGTAESFLIPGAIQAGPKAAMIIAKGGTKSEPLHFGIDLVAKGGIVYRDGEAVNLIHVGKHVEHGWHVGLFGAGKPFVTEGGQKVVGTWAHFYPSKAYIAGVGEFPYAGLLPTPIANALFGLLGGDDRAPRLGASNDPNHLSSLPIEGPVRSTEPPITFHVDFENLKDATAAATQVTVTVPIDDDFDLASTQFLGTSHADHVTAEIDEAKRELRWEFTQISLPPNKTSPEGEGFAEFSIRPKAEAVSGTELTAKASIVFDFNPAIETNTTTHRLDTVAPTATIASAKANGSEIQIEWTASDPDPGSGVADVRLIVAPINGHQGQEVVATGNPMRVSVASGRRYEIRALATDNAGNVSAVTDPITVTVSRPWWLYSLIAAIVVAGIAITVRRIRSRRRASL